MQNASQDALIRKVLRRLIPFCMLCYVFNYVDRVNISMAQLRMQDSAGGVAGFDGRVFATGASIFFLGYFLFEVPSNLIMRRVGARRWIARIMISWGIVSMCMVFTSGPRSFYLLRFLLGLAEAGFFPGVMLYLSSWLPQRYHARAAALFLTSTAIAGLIGNPLGGSILAAAEKWQPSLGFWKPLSWQWLFLIEAIPSIMLGFFTLFLLTDRPEDAPWLNPAEKDELNTLLAQERNTHPAAHAADFFSAFSSVHTWLLSLIYSLVIFSFYLVNFYTPAIVRRALFDAGMLHKPAPGVVASSDPFVFICVGLFSAIPFGTAAVAMVLIGRHADKKGERKFHLAFACGLIAVGMCMAALAQTVVAGGASTVLTIAGLSVGAAGSYGIFGPFWALPSQFLAGTAAAAAFAIINSIGNLFGGYLGPLLMSRWNTEGRAVRRRRPGISGDAGGDVLPHPPPGSHAIAGI